MNKLFRSMLVLLANSSILLSAFTANSTCHLLIYEPEMPDEVKALVK